MNTFKHAIILSIFLSLSFSAHSAETENKPLDLSIAATPEEFRCEALQISDYDKVNESMASLKKTINSTFGVDDSCVSTTLAKPENQKHLNELLENIGGGVSTVRGQLANMYVESIAQIATGSLTSQQAYEITSQQQLKAKEAVNLVVGSIRELNAMIEKNPLNVSSPRNCKTYYSSSEKLVFGVAEMVEDISPLLIQAVSRIPGLQELAPAVIGVSMVSSAVTQYAAVAQKRVDIAKPENRTAILINTCQLVKTYNKMRMLRGLKENPLEEKKKISDLITVQKNIVLKSNSKTGSSEINSTQRQWIAVIDEQNQIYRRISEIKPSLTAERGTALCESRDQVLDLSSNLISLQDSISKLVNQEPSLLDDSFIEQISKYQALSSDEKATKEACARSTLALFQYLESFNRRIFQNLMEIKKGRLSQNSQVMKASANLNFLRSFQTVLEQTNSNSLFEKLQASIGKTEALVNQSSMLKAWFGNAKNFYSPFDTYRNPVMDLMKHYENQFLMFRKPFAKTADDFDRNLYLLYRHWYPPAPNTYDLDHFKEFQRTMRVNLKILSPAYLDMKNITTVTGRSSPHERACTGLLSMRDTYRTMIESWNTLKYFCFMLRPLMNEPEVSKDLRALCMGVDDLVPNSKRAKLSGVDLLLEPVSVPTSRMPIVLQKIQELKCEQ